MKKISLKNLNLDEVEQLSRDQLKNVLGGYSAGTTGAPAYCAASCTCPSGYISNVDGTSAYALTATCTGCAAVDNTGVKCSDGTESLCDSGTHCKVIPIET